jgi:hypothetical protein
MPDLTYNVKAIQNLGSALGLNWHKPLKEKDIIFTITHDKNSRIIRPIVRLLTRICSNGPNTHKVLKNANKLVGDLTKKLNSINPDVEDRIDDDLAIAQLLARILTE